VQPNDEQKLIRRIVRFRDRRAADELVGRYYREIYAYAYRQTGDKEPAMDLAQEIFLRVLRALSTYDPGKASFRTWLYRVAASRAADYFRSRAYRQGCREQGLPEDSVSQEKDLSLLLEQRDMAEKIMVMIADLEDGTQQILRLKLFSELTFAQIAAVAALPEGTVKTRYYAAVKEIRARLEDPV
jgi:RNA polymerase sigma factor (sigma-70 family)